MTGQALLFGDADQEWKTKAVCRQQNPELFFPNRGDHDTAAQARQVCRSCPVITECLDDALSRKERHGVWGGLTPGERTHLRRQMAEQQEATA